MVARSKTSAAQRLERLILEILAYHKENLVTEHRVNELVVAAIEQSWSTIRAHKDVMRNVIELILRDGIDAGEFERVDPRETAELVMRSVVPFTNPLVVGQCLEEGDDLAVLEELAGPWEVAEEDGFRQRASRLPGLQRELRGVWRSLSAGPD